jgi:hypothetical protein
VIDSNFSSVFAPAPDFVRTDADVNFFFLAPNDISFVGISDDPFFPAHSEPYTISSAPGLTLYRPDVWSSVLGCVDQYEICNPSTAKCTPLVGLPSLQDEVTKLSLSVAQTSTADVILWALKETGLSSSIAGRGSAALKAQGTVYSNRQGPLPNNQWTVEAASWYDTALAKLQFAVVDFAQGPGSSDQKVMTLTPPLSRQTCDVKVRSGGYTNFSVLGIAIVFGVGGFLWVFSWVVDTIIGKLQKATGWGTFRRATWLLDCKMQLLRQLYETFGPDAAPLGKRYAWEGFEDSVPVLEDKTDIVDMPDVMEEDEVETEGHIQRRPRYGFRDVKGETQAMLPAVNQDEGRERLQ